MTYKKFITTYLMVNDVCSYTQATGNYLNFHKLGGIDVENNMVYRVMGPYRLFGIRILSHRFFGITKLRTY